MKLSIPMALATERHAIARMFVDLSLAFRDSIPGQSTAAPDANRTLLALTVVMGHASGHPMTATEIAAYVHLPRASVLRGLNALVERNVIERVQHRYYLHRHRAQNPPEYMGKYELILAQAFEVLGPYLSRMDA